MLWLVRVQLCCHLCSRHDLGQGRTCSSSSGPLRFVIGGFPLSRVEFLAFVQMNTLTYEWSLGCFYKPIKGAVARLLATVGGACPTAANHLSADCGLLYWIFQLFFIHKKTERESQKKASIHKTCPGTKVLTCFSSPAPTNSRASLCFYLVSCLYASTYGEHQEKWAYLRERVLYIKQPHNKDADVNQFRDMHSCILVVLSLRHTRPTS